MRRTMHLCLSSHDEIMFRNEEDLVMGFNCLALAVLETESRLLAEGFLPTHHHTLVQTDSVKELIRRERYAYTRYFNAKYRRKGKLGESVPFQCEVTGVHHMLTATNYVIRQGLHHGLASTPFEYPFCSANAFFRKELGKDATPELLPEHLRYKYLPHNHELPIQYRMQKNGQILREDILDIAYVRELYITPRNYLFQMNRITDEKTIREQTDENTTPPITLEGIEKGVPEFDISQALVCEQGRVNHQLMTDLELCRIIDGYYLPRCLPDKETPVIYDLPEDRRIDLGNRIWTEARNAFGTKATSPFAQKRIDSRQIRRCLIL